MSERPLRLAWLATLLLMLISASSWAQSVSCTGVPQWNASTIYNPGDRLVYQGSLYEAQIQIWNAPPTHCPSCNWYRVLGTCGGGTNIAPTAQLTSPANGATFTAPANISIAARVRNNKGPSVVAAPRPAGQACSADPCELRQYRSHERHPALHPTRHLVPACSQRRSLRQQ